MTEQLATFKNSLEAFAQKYKVSLCFSCCAFFYFFRKVSMQVLNVSKLGKYLLMQLESKSKGVDRSTFNFASLALLLFGDA